MEVDTRYRIPRGLRNSKNSSEIRRITNALLVAVDKVDKETLRKEISKLSTTNCWCWEYAIAKLLIENHSDFRGTRVIE